MAAAGAAAGAAAATGSSLAGAGVAGDAGGVASFFAAGGLALATGAGAGGSGPTLRLSFGLFGWLRLELWPGALSAAPNMLLLCPPGGLLFCG